MVKLVVEDNEVEEVFTVHKEIACYSSPVLNAAFNSEFEEGRAQSYNLYTTPAVTKLLIK